MAFTSKQFVGALIFFGLIAIVGVLAIIVILSQRFGVDYAATIAEAPKVRQLQSGTEELVIRSIRVEREGDCGSVVLLRNGDVIDYACDDTTKEDRLLLSSETANRVFTLIEKGEFESLQEVYYDSTLESTITLTIETNQGTKVIVISNSDTSAPTLEGGLGDLIDEIEEIEEELTQNDPSPPPAIPSPTPSVSPQASASASPTITPIASASPTPTPLPAGATPEPFRCDMLESQGVTVSNIRCLDE